MSKLFNTSLTKTQKMASQISSDRLDSNATKNKLFVWEMSLQLDKFEMNPKVKCTITCYAPDLKTAKKSIVNVPTIDGNRKFSPKEIAMILRSARVVMSTHDPIVVELKDSSKYEFIPTLVEITSC